MREVGASSKTLRKFWPLRAMQVEQISEGGGEAIESWSSKDR